jgi:hypothetical protein
LTLIFIWEKKKERWVEKTERQTDKRKERNGRLNNRIIERKRKNM